MLSDHMNTIKLVTNIVVTSSVGKVVKQVIAANTDPETRVEQAQVWIGSFAIGGMVAERAYSRTEPQIEKVVNFIDKWQESKNETTDVQE